MENRVSTAVNQFVYLVFHNTQEIFPFPWIRFLLSFTDCEDIHFQLVQNIAKGPGKALETLAGVFLVSLQSLDVHRTLTEVLSPHSPCRCLSDGVQALQHHPNAGEQAKEHFSSAKPWILLSSHLILNLFLSLQNCLQQGGEDFLGEVPQEQLRAGLGGF